MNKLSKKESQLVSCFLFCPVILLAVFGIYPILTLIEYSFTSWNGLSPTKQYIGIENYINILTDTQYLEVLGNSLIYFLSGIIQIITALVFAIILSKQIKGSHFFKALFVFPMLISGMAISMLFKLFLSPDGGLDSLLNLLGMEKHIRYWLGDPSVVNYTLGGISIWRYTGQSFILYYGAIQMIPIEHYKLTEIEGCNWLQTLRYVILPGIRTVLKINFILLTIGALSVFELPMILTNGGNGTTTFLLQTMKTAFEKKMFGLAASMAIIISIVLIILTFIQSKIYEGEEDD